MAKVRTLILRAPGTNCNVETAFAFEQAGAATTTAHVNELIRNELRLADFQIMVIPGGFSYGDDIGAGKVLANELDLKLGQDLEKFTKSGGLILGICNGFQVMVKAGLLPEPFAANGLKMTLTNNDSGRFECRWVYLAANPHSPCVFTRGIERMYLPVAHGEGKVVLEGSLPESSEALYYVSEAGSRETGYPDNPNGSARNIAGVCDSSGRIFALMPHPERHIRRTQHPRWTRNEGAVGGDGFRVFQNAVNWAAGL